MRPWLFVLLVGCGLDEESFRKRYDDLYCDVLESECGGACREQEEGPVLTCDFDRANAKECLDGNWECVPLGTGRDAPQVPQGPEACHDVFTNCELGPEGDTKG